MDGLSILLYLFGSMMLIGGVVINYFVNRNIFNRRYFAIKPFRSFEHRNIIVFKEELRKFIAYFLIISGGLLMVFGWINNDVVKNKHQHIEKVNHPQKPIKKRRV